MHKLDVCHGMQYTKAKKCYYHFFPKRICSWLISQLGAVCIKASMVQVHLVDLGNCHSCG